MNFREFILLTSRRRNRTLPTPQKSLIALLETAHFLLPLCPIWVTTILTLTSLPVFILYAAKAVCWCFLCVISVYLWASAMFLCMAGVGFTLSHCMDIIVCWMDIWVTSSFWLIQYFHGHEQHSCTCPLVYICAHFCGCVIWSEVTGSWVLCMFSFSREG